ncbi:MAG: hypothetical protein J7M27_03915 [Candidatus Latescibacteria bacterium]|nr:hypothetical protein [Candidatus Latescibacterota bacterium]
MVLIHILVAAIVFATSGAAFGGIFKGADIGKVIERTAEGPLRVGFGKATIAPPWPIEPSYGKQTPTFEFYHHEIEARALVLWVGELKILLVACDVIGIGSDGVDVIKGEIKAATGIPKEHMIIVATHNHSYPRTRREKVRDWIAQQATEAVVEALAEPFRARIGFGTGIVPESITVNRHRAVGGMVNTHLPVMRIDDINGDPRGVLFNFGSHPNIFTTSWGGDRIGKFGPGWPGYARQWIEMTYGLKTLFSQYEREQDYHDLFTIFVIGAAGDQQPSLDADELDGKKVYPREAFVTTVGRKVLETMEGIETKQDVRMTFRSKMIELPLKANGWRKESRTAVSALIINDAAIGIIPGELTAELGARFEQEAGYGHSLLITIANDYIGYITSEKEAFEGATYEGKGSPFGPERGRIIMNEVIGLVNPNSTPAKALDPHRDLGTIRGRVRYDGRRRIIVGLIGDAILPSGLSRFWGRRVEPDSSGGFAFDRVAPWTRFLYVKEVSDDYDGKEGKDGRTLLSGEAVTVTAAQATEVDLKVPGHLKDHISALVFEPSSLSVEKGKVRGRITIEGELREDERIVGGIYDRSKMPWTWHTSYYLRDPVRTVEIDQSGTFEFGKLSAGLYTLVFWFDTNGNGRPEQGVDVMTTARGVAVE